MKNVTKKIYPNNFNNADVRFSSITSRHTNDNGFIEFGPTLKSETISSNWKSFENDEKYIFILP